MSLSILYQDEWLVVVDKPAGLLVHRSRGDAPVVVMTMLRDLLGKHVYPAHRLDRFTSGALALAVEKDFAPLLQGLFERRQVEKTYLALVAGEVPKSGLIDTPLLKDNGSLLESATEYESLDTKCGVSYVRVRPRQGRKHQIRRHFQSIGHPLLGDLEYGDAALNAMVAERYRVGRLALHASELAFIHPLTDVPLRVTAPLAKDLCTSLALLKERSEA